MSRLSNMSIRSKYTLVIMITSSIALLLAIVAFIIYEVYAFHKELVNNVTVLADTVGSNCAAALDFNDIRSAQETLAALDANKHIIAAAVYSKDGTLFAKWERDTQHAFQFSTAPQSGHKFHSNLLGLFRPIERHGNLSGTIFLASDLSALSGRLLRYFGIVGLAYIVSMLTVLALSGTMQRMLSDPILSLARVARRVAQENNYSVRAKKFSNDELGQLTDGFNQMLDQIQARDTALAEARNDLERRVEERTEELKNIHTQLLQTSRQAGMAEVATNVLHNVGNVLNSLNVSTALVAANIRESRSANLGKLVTMMQDNLPTLGHYLTEDPKGKQIPGYLARLHEQLQKDRETVLKEMDALRVHIEHINEIVAMQQNLARVSGVWDILNPVELVEDSLRMNEDALKRHSIKVVRHFAAVPPINTDKHKVLQILINLVTNAQQACIESNRDEKLITVQLKTTPNLLKISIADNGVGIPPDNLTRVFNHGFTTRRNGHGFGLHSGALAARELGGALKVTSNGVGLGATFTLELPISQPHKPC
jgi:two-component system, NtrC family, sensor kinase